MPQDIPATCDDCGEKFSIEHAISYPKGGLVLGRHDDAAKEWGALGDQALAPSSTTYEPKINRRTVQGERTGARAQQGGGGADGGADTVGAAQECRVRTVNGADILVGQPRQVVVPA